MMVAAIVSGTMCASGQEEKSDVKELVARRTAFLQKNFSTFTPVRFEPASNGLAAIQVLQVRSNRLEFEGRFYSGFRFTVPDWVDGDFEWLHVLAKTEAQKDFGTHTMQWYIIPEQGQSEGFEDFTHYAISSCPRLKERFPWTHVVFFQELSLDRLTPGRTYAIWFSYKEEDMVNIAFSMTIDSVRGHKEFGELPK